VLNLDASTATDSVGNRIQNCVLEAVATNGAAATLLALNNNIEFSADNVTFGDCTNGQQVRCMKSGSGHLNWSNANSFRSCSFIKDRAYSVLNPAQQTSFFDCTFEDTDALGTAPVACNLAGSSANAAINFHGCGFWDSVSGSGTWISSSIATQAWGFYGCTFDIPPTGTAFDLSSHNGLVVSACFFNAPNGGTPNVFKAGQNITNGSMLGSYVKSPAVDNHASVFV
jgi:hypothetical protein